MSLQNSYWIFIFVNDSNINPVFYEQMCQSILGRQETENTLQWFQYKEKLGHSFTELRWIDSILIP